ncbi:hypothetical protein GCM10009844_45170 [Nocardioides koreensis]|uniref:DUF3224 domain-containing protein n=1 Tax=Nocardioides koreensis TaxID=433651 RepID=A0ABP5LYU1_9ACTN
MNKTLAASAALISVTMLSGAAVLPGAATAKSTVHTTKLVLTETGSHNVGKNSFVGTDKARSAETGKFVGFDTVSGSFNRKTHEASVDVALAVKGGLIIGHVSLNESDPRFKGTITSGTGAFEGITGTIRGRQVGDTGKTFVTLRWEL